MFIAGHFQNRNAGRTNKIKGSNIKNIFSVICIYKLACIFYRIGSIMSLYYILFCSLNKIYCSLLMFINRFQ